MARTCVFCNENGVTREHAWPDWLNSILRDREGWTFTHSDEDRGIARQWTGPRLDQTVRRVCGTCNGGWMSQLEADTKPIIVPMILGRNVRLDSFQQELLRRWAYKTILMLALASETSPIPTSHYSWFYEHRDPPPSVNLRMAMYAGTRWTNYFRNQALAVEGGDLEPTYPNGYYATVVVGRLTFQALGHHGLDAISVGHRAPGAFLQIWPARGHDLRWPPVYGMSDKELEAATRFTRNELSELAKSLL